MAMNFNPKISKAQLARCFLLYKRRQGYKYIEVRQRGRNFILHCNLCLVSCHAGKELEEHLGGNRHENNLSCARLTLIKPNPWPFSDGFRFFNPSTEDKTPISPGDRGPGNLKVRGVMIKEKNIDLEARFIGLGLISAWCFETKENPVWIDTIACEWFGEEIPDYDKSIVPSHDFAIVTFSYVHNLGRPGCHNKTLRDSNQNEDWWKKRKPSSNPEEISEILCNQYEAYEDVSSIPNSAIVDLYDDPLIDKRLIRNRHTRREMKRDHREFCERKCHVCKQKFIPGKDVAAIVNMKTGNFACSSRNTVGLFHPLHVSCAIHWFLFCEYDILLNTYLSEEGRNQTNNSWDYDFTPWCKTEIFSVFCPECQGTGIDFEPGVPERETFFEGKVPLFEVRLSESRKAWFTNPEPLEKCSLGLRFPQQVVEPGQERAGLSRNLVRFYRAQMPL